MTGFDHPKRQVDGGLVLGGGVKKKKKQPTTDFGRK